MKQHPSVPTSVIMLVCGLIAGYFMFSSSPHGVTEVSAKVIENQEKATTDRDSQSAAEIGLLEIDYDKYFVTYTENGPYNEPAMYLWKVEVEDDEDVELVSMWDSSNDSDRSSAKLEPYK